MPGQSHQAVRDIAALSAVPGLTLLEPRCEQEVAMAQRYCMGEAAGLREAIRGCRWLFTLDDHYVAGGQGQMIAATLGGLALMQPPQIHHFGVQEIPRCGQHDEVLRAHGLDAASLAEMIAHLIVSTGQRGAKAR